MKVVINVCYGGFGLSAQAIKQWATLKGRDCYFFSNYMPGGGIDFDTYYPISEEATSKTIFWSAFSVPNPNEVLMAGGEKGEYNAAYEEISLYERDIPRDDSDLVKVVEELGKAADGAHAELKVVEVPDDVEWEIEEYDGVECVAEKHRTWC